MLLQNFVTILVREMSESDSHLRLVKKLASWISISVLDGDTGQVPPELAEELGIPQITYVQSIELSEDILL